MIDIQSILNGIISTLNEDLTGVKVIKNYNIKKFPPYPYMTVGVTTGYIAENATDKPNITMSYNPETDKGLYMRHENPQMTFSLSVFSDDESQASQVCTNAIAAFKFLSLEKLNEKGIIPLDVTSAQNRTSLLEVDYVYQFGFDVRIRVESILEKEYDTTKSISLNDLIIE